MKRRNNTLLEVAVVFFIAALTIGGIVYLGSFTQKAAASASGTEASINQPPAPNSQSSGGAASTLNDYKAATGAIPDICTGKDSGNFDCYQSYYQNLVRTKGIPAAFADLKARYTKDSYVQTQCHPLTHVLGRTAAEKFTKVSEAYTEGDNFCASGYFHGVLETFVHRVGLQNLKGNINSICSDLNVNDAYGLDYYNCVHGLGHGLMAVTDDQLFQSLSYCDALKGDWEQFSCASGVYMENIIADGLNHTTNYLDPKRPLYPCTDSPEKYKGACYFLQTSYMLKINNSDFTKTFQWCSEAGSNEYLCDQSLGRDASGHSVEDGVKTQAICMLGQTAQERTDCAIGGVKDIIYYFHSDKQGLAFCNLFDDPIKSTCLTTARSYYSQSF